MRAGPHRFVASVAVVGMAAACSGSVAQFVSTNAPVIALTHVRVIDGTGRRAIDDQALVLQNGRIEALGPASRVAAPSGSQVLDLHGRTVMPGLVGMHEHLFYQYEQSNGEVRAARAADAFAKLYLASGVTTIRTAGTLALQEDLHLKAAIDGGRAAGPHVHVTGRYVNPVSRALDPEAVAQQVADDADAGATSVKAYTYLRHSELDAAIRAAHDRGLRITGHLCAVGFREAAVMGIDNLEHGLPFDTEFYSGKQDDVCPNQYSVFSELSRMDIGDVEIRETISRLVQQGVAITSTLAAIEMYTGRDDSLDPRTLSVLADSLQPHYLSARAAWRDGHQEATRLWSAMLRKEMQFERAFVSAGGRLMAGVDPTGWGGIVAGFGDQRELELLVEAGFTAEEAIKIASFNGAAFLLESDQVGTIAAGQRADLVVVPGDPVARIADVRNVEIVFKGGVGYNPAALVEAAQGGVGRFDLWHMLYSPFDVFLMGLVAALAAAVAWKRMRHLYPRPVALPSQRRSAL